MKTVTTKSKPASAPRKPAARTKPAAKKATPRPSVAKKAPAKRVAAPATSKKSAPAKASRTATKPRAATARPGTRKKTSRTAKPKGLEASYSGKIFRSRLEARWAILLDLLEINWDYEPSHYQLGPELWYLPDFYLPDLQLWLEVKGPVFMDAQSAAKCLASVAGPQPLPLREAPYTAATQLLIGGPLHPREGTTPQHTLVTKSSAGMAALSYAALTRKGLVQVTAPWDVTPATGAAKTRRPTPERIAVLVDPPARPGMTDLDAFDAYKVAAKQGFDDSTKTLVRSTDPQILQRLARRRAGRPLGPFPPKR